MANIIHQSVDSDLKIYSGIKSDSLNKWNGKKANFIGDSITYGAWNNAGTWTTVKPYHQWLKDLLGLSVVRNYGVSGTSIASANGDSNSSISVRFPEMDNDADLIVVLGGTNDFGLATSSIGVTSDRITTTFYGACHVLMEGLIKKYMGKTIVFITPIQRGNTYIPNTLGKNLKDYCNIIKEVAEYYGITIIDGLAIVPITPKVPELKTAYMEDDLHPNASGHELIGRRLASVFNTI